MERWQLKDNTPFHEFVNVTYTFVKGARKDYEIVDSYTYLCMKRGVDVKVDGDDLKVFIFLNENQWLVLEYTKKQFERIAVKIKED